MKSIFFALAVTSAAVASGALAQAESKVCNSPQAQVELIEQDPTTHIARLAVHYSVSPGPRWPASGSTAMTIHLRLVGPPDSPYRDFVDSIIVTDVTPGSYGVEKSHIFSGEVSRLYVDHVACAGDPEF
jgi:hypothetical protein